MKLKTKYATKERYYVSKHAYRNVSKEIKVEPIEFIRYPCGSVGAARSRYYYQFFFLAPDDAEFTEKRNGLEVCRENVNREMNRHFKPKDILWENNRGVLPD